MIKPDYFADKYLIFGFQRGFDRQAVPTIRLCRERRFTGPSFAMSSKTGCSMLELGLGGASSRHSGRRRLYALPILKDPGIGRRRCRFVFVSLLSVSALYEADLVNMPALSCGGLLSFMAGIVLSYVARKDKSLP